MRGWMKGIFIALVALMLPVSCMVFFIVAFPTTIRSQYANYQEAIASQAVNNMSWIPKWLPKSAYEIEEVHDLDVNTMDLNFRFNGTEKLALGKECQPTQLPENASSGTFDIHESSFRYYECDGHQHGYLAVSYERGEAYFWKPYSPD